MMKLNSKTLSILMMAGLLAPNAARARYIRPQLEATPVDRLGKNLSEQLKAKPKDVMLRFNLARVHAMAFALKTDQAKVRSGKENLGAWFGYEPRHVPFKAVRTKDGAKLKAAGVPTAMHLLPGLAHGIDGRGIAIATEFMREVLGSKQ